MPLTGLNLSLYNLSGNRRQPVPPAPAVEWGFTRLSFEFDGSKDTTSQIDMNNTGAEGYKFYIRNGWPNINAATGNWAPAATLPATNPAYIDVSGGSLNLLNYSALEGGTTGQVIHTCGYADNEQGYVGQTFSGGAFIDFTISYDSALSSHLSPSWPAVWLNDVRALTGEVQHFGEIDCYEAYPNPGGAVNGFAFHDWNFANDGNSCNTNTANGTVPVTDYKDNFIRLGTLWVPMAMNGGTGLIRRYVINQLQPTNNIQYFADAPAQPDMQQLGNILVPANPNGCLSVTDEGKLMLIVSCGVNWPSHFQYVRVWQLPE